MVETLFVTGLTLFLLGTAVCMRDADRKGESSLLFLVPLAGVAHVRHNWRELWWAAMCRLLGGALVLLAVGLVLVRHPDVREAPMRLLQPDPDRVLYGTQQVGTSAFVSSADAVRLVLQDEDNPRLSGRLSGKQFVYRRAQLVDGILSVANGDELLAELEVRILLGDLKATDERQTFSYAPGDQDMPEIHLSWKPAGVSLPQTRIIRSGYRLMLQLAPLGPHRLNGFMQLVLPDDERSYLTGNFTAMTNNLRYTGNKVDLFFDHADTLEYVARQYLVTQFPAGTIANIRFVQTNLRRTQGVGDVVARINLANGRIEERKLGLVRSHTVGWTINAGTMETRVLAETSETPTNDDRNDQQSMPATKTSAEPVQRETRSFAELAEFVGKQVTIQRASGDLRDGRITRLDRNKLFLEAMIGSGTIEFFVSAEDLRELRLPGGQVISVTAGQQLDRVIEPVIPDGDQSVEEIPDGEPSSDQLADFRVLLGKQVRIQSQGGRTRDGVLVRLERNQLVLEVPVGSGTLEYFYRPNEIRSIEQVTGQ